MLKSTEFSNSEKTKSPNPTKQTNLTKSSKLTNTQPRIVLKIDFLMLGIQKCKFSIEIWPIYSKMQTSQITARQKLLESVSYNLLLKNT